jgi:hypothetical protein
MSSVVTVVDMSASEHRGAPCDAVGGKHKGRNGTARIVPTASTVLQ